MGLIIKRLITESGIWFLVSGVDLSVAIRIVSGRAKYKESIIF